MLKPLLTLLLMGLVFWGMKVVNHNMRSTYEGEDPDNPSLPGWTTCLILAAMVIGMTIWAFL
jgi:hypothetical protein